MTKKIEKLTPAQTRNLAAYYDEMLAAGRSTEPADRPAAEAAINGMYARLGKKNPQVLWLDSPFLVCVSGAILDVIRTQARDGSQLRSQLESQLWSQLESQLWSQLRSQLRSQLGSQLRSQLESQLRSQLESQLWSQLRSQLESQLGSQLRSQLRSQLGSQLGSQLRSQLRSQLGSQLGLMFWGQHELGWLSFYSFAHKIGVKYDAKDIEALDWWMRLGTSTCWWQPRNGVVLASDRAAELCVDDQGRLHATDRMAMRFRDGWGVWAINGVRVDEQLVMTPETQTTKQIRDERNEEIKRVRIERFAGRDETSTSGWRRYLREIGAIVTHSRRNDIDNTNEALMQAPDGMTVFIGACRSTGRVYALEVPASVLSCEQAQNWMRSGTWLDRLDMKCRLIGAA